jgi:hypothetical protein
MSSKLKKYFSSAGLAILAMGIIVASSDAQTSKTRKRAKKTPIVQTAPAPTTEPVIISRAEDYQLDVPVASQSVENSVRLTEADTPSSAEKIIAELTDRIKALESSKKDDYDQKQKRLAMNLDILTKAEQRVESLRKQSFEMLDKENSLKTRLEQIDSDLRPESIERSVAFVGSLRPEELRASRKKSLEAERNNVQSLLTEIQRTRSNLDLNVQKAEMLVERLRTKLEGDIDSALDDNPNKP